MKSMFLEENQKLEKCLYFENESKKFGKMSILREKTKNFKQKAIF